MTKLFDDKDFVWRLFQGFRLILILFSLTGCATPVVKQASIEGINYTLHLDADDLPQGCDRTYLSGCHIQRNDGSQHVFVSAVTPAHMVRHEVVGHVKGMRHSEWKLDAGQKANCAWVYRGTAEYPRGSRICMNERSEWIVPREKA